MGYLIPNISLESPALGAFLNPTNILSCAGIVENGVCKIQEWISKDPNTNHIGIIPIYRSKIADIKSIALALIVIVSSMTLFGMSVNYSATSFNHHPGFLALNYLPVALLLLYQVSKNSIISLKRDREAIQECPDAFMLGIERTKQPFTVNLKDQSTLLAFKEYYHEKVMIFVFKLLALTSIFVVCGLGTAGIMSTKRFSQVTLAVGCLGYYFGSYLLRVHADYRFFTGLNKISTGQKKLKVN